MSYSLTIKSVYDFTLKASAILGYGYKSATVLVPYLDYDSANAIEDVTPIHASVYPQLTAGTPVNAADLVYVKIRTSTGQIRVLAMDWIAVQPVLVTSTTANVVVADIALTDLDRLRQCLLQNGFSSITITTL